MTERRANANPLDIAGALAGLYTLSYMVMVGLLFFISIPPDNKDLVNTLVGIMSAVQMAIIQFYFGSSKNAEATQRAVAQRQERTETALVQTIAQGAPSSTGNQGSTVKTDQVTVETGGDVNINQEKK